MCELGGANHYKIEARSFHFFYFLRDTELDKMVQTRFFYFLFFYRCASARVLRGLGALRSVSRLFL